MRNIFKSKSNLRTLKIQGDDQINILYPGDVYTLTLNMDMKTPAMRGNATIAVSYSWDGKTLKRKMF